MQSVSVSASPGMLRPRWWPEGWWKIVDLRIGIIPIPIYAILIALLVGFVFTGDIKGEISVMIAVLVIGGFTCAEIGKRTPVLRNIGAAAIFATVYRLHHRRQHPRYGPQGAGAGVFENIRATGD